MGQCSYTLIKHKEFTIEAENIPCSATSSQVIGTFRNICLENEKNNLEWGAETL